MRNGLEGIVGESGDARRAAKRLAGDSVPGLSILLTAGGDVNASRTEGSLDLRDYRCQTALAKVQTIALRREEAAITTCRFLLLQL